MQKRFITLIFIFIFFSFGKCYAQSQFSPVLAKMEKSIFGMDYDSQTDAQRLSRLEENVYGKSSSSPINQRIEKLSKDLSADLIGQEIKPKKDTFADEEEAYKDSVPKADSSVNYPIVNDMEKEVFRKEFKTTEINQRLSNLEQKVFKKSYNTDDLSTRVDRLKLAVLPDRPQPTDSYLDEDTYTPDDMLSQKSPKNYSSPTYNSQNSVLDEYQTNPDITIPLASLEKSMLKKSFPDDLVSNRLTRLEVQMFGSNFVDDDEQTRLDRITSAHQAKKSASKYDSNKFSQHMSTAVQVGAMLLLVLAAIL